MTMRKFHKSNKNVLKRKNLRLIYEHKKKNKKALITIIIKLLRFLTFDPTYNMNGCGLNYMFMYL